MKISWSLKSSILIVCAHFLSSILLLKVLRHTTEFQLFELLLIVPMISGVTIALFLAVVPRNKSKSDLNKYFFLMLISLLIMFIIGPNTLLNIDRSRSFYILSWVNSHSIKIGSNDELIISVKSPEKSNSIAIRERLQEQTERGLIRSIGNKYELTWKGKITYQIAEVLAKFFALQGWMNNRI